MPTSQATIHPSNFQPEAELSTSLSLPTRLGRCSPMAHPISPFRQELCRGRSNSLFRVRAEEAPATPLPPVSQTLTLSRRSPAITRLNIATRSASGFELAVTGFSTPRSLTQVTCNFIPAQGANLQTSTVTLGLTTSAATWFQSQTSATLGGQFRLLIPFTVQGELTAIQSVSVTLTNGEGTSDSFECSVLRASAPR